MLNIKTNTKFPFEIPSVNSSHYDQIKEDEEDYNNPTLFYTETLALVNKNKEGIFQKKDIIIKERDYLIEQSKPYLNLGKKFIILILQNKNYQNIEFEEIENKEKLKIDYGIQLPEYLIQFFKNSKIESYGNKCLFCKVQNEELFSLNCGHNYCKKCWKFYLTQQFRSPINLLKVKCPTNNCTCIVYEQYYKHFLPDKLELINKVIEINFLKVSTTIKKCPSIGCELFYISENPLPRKIICLCGKEFCFKCIGDTHNPIDCDIIIAWEKLKIFFDLEPINQNEDEIPRCKACKLYNAELEEDITKIEKYYYSGFKRLLSCICKIGNEIINSIKQIRNKFREYFTNEYIPKNRIIELYKKSLPELKENIKQKLNKGKSINLDDLEYLDICCQTCIDYLNIFNNSNKFIFFMKGNDGKTKLVNEIEKCHNQFEIITKLFEGLNIIATNEYNNYIKFRCEYEELQSKILSSRCALNSNLEILKNNIELEYRKDLENELIKYMNVLEN